MFTLLKDKFKKIKARNLIVIFFIVNIFFLKNFPFIHSDEAWLSGLSREIMQSGSLASTESFFDLMPRNSHAIKILFHLCQILFIKIFGYKIFTFRLISLISGSLALFIFYKIVFLITKSKALSLSALIMLAFDIHFIYSAHLARQEIILVFIFLVSFYYFLKNIVFIPSQNINNNTLNSNQKLINKKSVYLSIILALAIGFHPNAFIIALAFILIYTYNLFFSKKLTLKAYLCFAIPLALTAFFFVYLSFNFDPNFINNYSSYGANLGVLDPFIIKLENLKYFYLKLFYRVSGTYYIPPIKLQLIFFSLIFIFSLIKVFFKKDKINLYLILSFLAINLGYLIIGRYNQTTIIFIFPIAYLLFFNLIKDLDFSLSSILIIMLLTVLSLNTTFALIEDSHYNYDQYLNQIAEVVDKDDRVLANLNTDFYFNNNSLYDYRNLAFLKENNLSFSDYISKNNIQYIIYPEEMDFIYNSRPKWNILYGNLYPYYSEMQEFLKNKSSLVKEFTNSTYAIRIVKEINKKDWSVKIYKVNSQVYSEAAQKAD